MSIDRYPPAPVGYTGTAAQWRDLIDTQRARESEARERYAAQLQTAADAKAAERQAERDAAAAVELGAYEQRARAAFPGGASDWAAQWPAIKAQYQRERAMQGAGAELERLRASGKYDV